MTMPMDPMSPPSPVTPADAASSPANYANVFPHGQGPAPYDIQAALPDTAGPFAAAVAVSGEGVLYPQGPRQAATQVLLGSPEGFGEYDIQQGYAGGGGGSWPCSAEPPESYTVATGTD
jgi:hypothetical protein